MYIKNRSSIKMHIICEQCQMKFKAKRGAIKKHGRVVRCGNCDYEWIAKPHDSNIIHAKRMKLKIFSIIIPLLMVVALALFAVFLRNDETFYFLQLNDNRYFSIESIDTHFYKSDDGGYAVIKTKISNMSDEVRQLDSILVVLEGDGKIQQSMIDDLSIHVLPKKSIIVPIRLEDINLDLPKSSAYLGGKNLLRIKWFFL